MSAYCVKQVVDDKVELNAGEGDDARLKELCMELLDKRPRSSEDTQTQSPYSTVLGLDKQQLLQDEVLKRFSNTHQAVSRLKAEISDLLSNADV